jgi:hypothetical protein
MVSLSPYGKSLFTPFKKGFVKTCFCGSKLQGRHWAFTQKSLMAGAEDVMGTKHALKSWQVPKP